MTTTRKRQFFTLVLGDLFVFAVSLWVALLLRNLAIPQSAEFFNLATPFLFIFALWHLIFFISGLYDAHVLLIKSKLPKRVFTAHVSNVALASIFFYLIPYFGVTPKVILFLYLIVSTLCIAFWRFGIYQKIVQHNTVEMLILGEGEDIEYLKKRLDTTIHNSPIKVIDVIYPTQYEKEGLLEKIKSVVSLHPQVVVAVDLSNPVIQKNADQLYGFIFNKVQFVEVQNVYEDVTDMVPLGLINEVWFLKHASIEPNVIYDVIKRAMDILIAIPLFVVSLLVYPFVWMGMKIEDGGALFYTPERIGESGKPIKIYKFRTMSVMDSGNQLGQNANKITRLGKIMRVTRIDELPQLWNILNGDMSLIGPRPEFPTLVELYKKEIPHYNVRHLIRPGLSGWAQIHHEKPPHSVEETREKLALDLYYIKHRSVWLDLKIALQTIKTLLSRVGV